MPDLASGATPSMVAAAVGTLFERLFAQLDEWRIQLVDGDVETTPGRLDERVRALVVPLLSEPDPLLIGAGFIAAPEFVRGRDVHFSWWLGPLEANPVFGATTEPTKLDLATRNHADYLRDFRSLEWYRVPESTHRTHVTGPYVDHLCACDYIITVTSPVEAGGTTLGVVGADIFVKRLEHELLPALLAIDGPVSLINGVGRVMMSTDPALAVGDVLYTNAVDIVACPGAPFALALTGKTASNITLGSNTS
ncbi:cache domain-containing protein [Leifsonia poae]|uniref:cache domain-containing protein n=1 Tax=Leifsonia poae TaxID=110933 RepID=UPI001CBF2C74|nr:cache domain-containing protein [Leifsonia poae]